ncbi:2-oxo acid dehydrogenase subunit E2 [Herbaspirillum sp. B65]|uniref:2-oxo acid dehydrogenase subunit E2 n=1 Tax=Herbaspirillum sp. B65 TaxID=137708 RepID=UPI0006791AB2|nr:2-oxo acid dehydrogenase subunit E2 [Herbaspirillum sp. B65]
MSDTIRPDVGTRSTSRPEPGSTDAGCDVNFPCRDGGHAKPVAVAERAPAPVSTGFGADLPPWPDIDFSEFGATEVKPVSRIQKLVGSFLSRNWVTIPHVTHHDEAEVDALEAYRKGRNEAGGEVKLTALVFMIKAVVKALQAYPQFNASLDASGKNLIYKKYFHIGVAVDTKFGLLVPVLRDCDRKSVTELAVELAALSNKARTKGLSLPEMSGGCFSISSLGGIGGTSFTPIVNAPEVAILGLSKTQARPFPGPAGEVLWRQMQPLSLSYDHRVINGADAARFTQHLATVLASPETLAQ